MGGFGQRSNPSLRTFGFPNTFGGVASFRGVVIALRPAWASAIPTAEVHRVEPPHEHQPPGVPPQPLPTVQGEMSVAELANQVPIGGTFTDPIASPGEAIVPVLNERSGMGAVETVHEIGIARRSSHDQITVEPIDSRAGNAIARPRPRPQHSKG